MRSTDGAKQLSIGNVAARSCRDRSLNFGFGELASLFVSSHHSPLGASSRDASIALGRDDRDTDNEHIVIHRIGPLLSSYHSAVGVTS